MNTNRRGVILITVFWALFFLSLGLLSLSVMSRMQLRLQSLQEEVLRMRILAREGLERALLVLQEDERGSDSLQDSWNKEFSLQAENGLLSYKIIDEDRFININRASPELIKNLGVLFPDMPAELLDAVIAARPYNVLREVLDKTEVSATDFYGRPEIYRPGLVDIMTVFGAQRVNINTASRTVLLLLPGMTMAAADAILGRRQSLPFEQETLLSEELSHIGLSAPLAASLPSLLGVRSTVFRVVSRAQSRNKPVSATITACVRRSDSDVSIVFYQE